MAPEANFPLFLLGTVLLPTESTVLHVFEDRYKELAARCIEEGGEFGLVYMEEEQPNEIGCASRIDEVVERFEDGRMNILVTGIVPIRIVQLEDSHSYPTAVVERIDDAVSAGDEDPEQRTRTQDAFADLVVAATDEEPDVNEVATLSAYGMAARVALDASDKQLLLELRDENARLADLEKIFIEGARTVSETRELARRAQTNGHGRYAKGSGMQ